MSNRVRSMTRVLVLGLGLAACQAVPDPRTAPIEALAPKVLPRAPSAPRIDAPELARLGQYAIGTTLDTIVLPARVALTTDGVSAARILARVSAALGAWSGDAPPCGGIG